MLFSFKRKEGVIGHYAFRLKSLFAPLFENNRTSIVVKHFGSPCRMKWRHYARSRPDCRRVADGKAVSVVSSARRRSHCQCQLV